MILHVNDANVVTSQGTLSSFSRPSYHMAQTPGSGNKLARLVYSWRDENGEPVTGDLPGQLWGLWDAERNPVFQTEDAMAGTQSQAISGTEHGIFTEGITVRAGSRMFLEVAARDNYALLEQSSLAEDAEALADAAIEVPVEGGEPRIEPRHAAFDLSQAEPEPFAEKAPYLPFMELEEQKKEENRMKPGVTWWIESKDERDRYAGIEGIREVHYQLPDSAIAPGLGQMVLSGGQPIRILKVRAQDGQGNFTVLDLPLRVVPNGFRARTLDWQSRRGGEVLD